MGVVSETLEQDSQLLTNLRIGIVLLKGKLEPGSTEIQKETSFGSRIVTRKVPMRISQEDTGVWCLVQ